MTKFVWLLCCGSIFFVFISLRWDDDHKKIDDKILEKANERVNMSQWNERNIKHKQKKIEYNDYGKKSHQNFNLNLNIKRRRLFQKESNSLKCGKRDRVKSLSESKWKGRTEIKMHFNDFTWKYLGFIVLRELSEFIRRRRGK